MSESALKTWLSKHEGEVPALDIYHQQALEALEDEASPLSQLADIITCDPGMSVSLYRQVNSRLKKAGRSILGTIHNALGLLGDKAVSDFVTGQKTLSKTHPHLPARQACHQLMSQGHHLLSQLELYSAIHGVTSLNEIRSAGILYNIGELYASLFDFERYQQHMERTRQSTKETRSANPEFGFEFVELGKLLASQWYLPELLAESLSINRKTGGKARLVQLAADIAMQAERDWNNPKIELAVKASADFLNRSQKEVKAKTLSIAIQSARAFPVSDVFPAAARLILLPDVEKPVPMATPEAAAITKPKSIRLNDQIRTLILSPKVTSTQLISTAINGLYEEFKFSRVVLIMPDQDGHLSPRISKGLPTDSPLHSLKIKIAQSGLFKHLMAKPQALWVSSANFKKYDSMLPGIFRSTCMNENFFLMSLFIGKKPVGFVYCDRSSTKNNLDQSLYSEFKTALKLTNKALTYIAHRNKKKAA